LDKFRITFIHDSLCNHKQHSQPIHIDLFTNTQVERFRFTPAVCNLLQQRANY